MTISIIIKKADINTTILGLNYQVTCDNGIVLNFTKAAIEELYNDMLAADKDFKERHEGKTQAKFYGVIDVQE